MRVREKKRPREIKEGESDGGQRRESVMEVRGGRACGEVTVTLVPSLQEMYHWRNRKHRTQ